MPRQNDLGKTQFPGRAALAVLLVLAVILTFGAGLALGRLWEAGSANPPTAESTAQVEPDSSPEATAPPPPPTALEPSEAAASPVSIEETDTPSPPTATPRPLAFSEGPIVYGHSHDGNELLAYRLGTGPSARALIGGIHGGYEWNTTELVSETLTHLQQNPDLIPSNVTLYVIPCANPDGAAAGTDAIHGRVNGNNVDLNRNWDYQHQITATHGTRPVYAGDVPFSEPETRGLRDFIFDRNIELAIFYHSAMAKIFSGAERENCATFELAEMMSEVTGYPHSPEGVYGQVTTGDAIDYLSKVGITAIEIELTTHEDIDWDRNWRGVVAFMDWEIPQKEASRQAEGAFIRHLVQPGETLSHLALEYGVDEAAILLANDGIDDPDQILAGQVILIPQESADR
jgi:hypothetical protein